MVSTLLLDKFISDFYPYKTRISTKLKDGNWFLEKEKRKLNSATYNEHIIGNKTHGIWLGNNKKNFVCIDFDRKDNRPLESYRKLILYVKNLFQCPQLLLTSSSSCNTHLYLFIKHHINSKVIKERISGVLVDKGIEIKAGFVELFIDKNLRLPFGKGSSIIDNGFNRLEKTLEDQIAIFVNYLNSEMPNIYQATPSYSFSIKESKFYKSEFYEKEFNRVLLEGLPCPGTRHDSLLTLTIGNAKKGLSREYTNKYLKEFMKRNGHNSRDYQINPSLVYKNIDTLVKYVYNNQSFNSKSTKEIQIEEELCHEIYKHFFKFGLKTQLSVFKLFQLIKKYYINGSKNIPISNKLLIEHFKFNFNNYKFVLQELEELGLLKLKIFGNNIKKLHSNIYEYTGPILIEGNGYSNFVDYLIKTKYYNTYSSYIKRKYFLRNAI